MAADRYLLFGLLALQIGLIQQTQLVAAFHAWTCNKSRSLADHLLDRGVLDADDRGAVEALVARHLKRHGGGVEQSLAAVPASRAVRVSLAALGEPEIEATLARVARSKNGPVTEAEDDDPEQTTSIVVGPATSDGQRFRILRPHARGGLGEVFVALDAELHREVALKQILEKHADDPVNRQRFIAEAEITGALEHPGVVPVYGLGTDANGRPYYAIRFIKGDSLKETIAQFHENEELKTDPGRRSLEFRRLLRRFTDVCNAIDYAHSRGVIHRDIKPANIIVGKHGETLVVDWGLAKAIGRADPSVGEQTIAPSSSGSSETLPGSALGTPAYMSPEQARGELEKLGPRSDVYSLGATLYCLLTGRPPQEGHDVGEILRRSQRCEFPRPRQVEPSVDQALEAVCLKAMALQPGDRYASPRLLAEDLERWMADEPVTAWREPFGRRARRWAKRNRTAVTGAAAAVLVGVVGLSAVLAVQSAANDELKRSQAAVQARYELAVEAIKTIHTWAGEDFLLKEERFKEVRERFLKTASDFYTKLGALLGKETDFASRRAFVEANFELAKLTERVGRKEAALAAHRNVLTAREALAAEPGADVEAKADVVRSLTEVASTLFTMGKANEALETYHRAESMLAGPNGSAPAAHAALAVCRTRMALLLRYSGKLPEAPAASRLARIDQEVLASAPGASLDARRELAETIDMIGYLLWIMDKPKEAVPEFRAAMPIYQKLADENPTVVEFRRGVGASRFYLGNVLPLTGKTAEGEAEFRRSLKIQQALLDENPAVSRFRRGLRLCHHYCGNLLLWLGKPEEAEAEIRKAMSLFRKLAGDDPAVPEFRAMLAGAQSSLGQVLLKTGKPAAAEAEIRKAHATLQVLADDNSAMSRFVDQIPMSLKNLGDVARSLGRAAEAKGAYKRAISLNERKLQEDPTNVGSRWTLAELLHGRALALRYLGDFAGAAADTRRAQRLFEGLSYLSGPDLFLRACSHAALAGLAGRPGSGVTPAEDEAEADKAIEVLRRAVAMGYRNANELRIESALDPLRNRPDFRLLMRDVVFPAEPFAPPPPIP